MSRSEEENWELVSHCFVWFALLVGGFAIGGLVMLYTVENPILINNSLKFDNTKFGPAALSCTNTYNRKRLLDITISLMVPETYYNSKRGDFVVRIQYISRKGEVSATAWHPITVPFKSHFMRYLLSFLGISSNAQVVTLVSKGIEPSEPITCIRVTLQKEGGGFRGGVGVPEISGAHLLLKSQLPHFKRILWDWWNTMFICISILSFGMVALCCRQYALFPKGKFN